MTKGLIHPDLLGVHLRLAELLPFVQEGVPYSMLVTRLDHITACLLPPRYPGYEGTIVRLGLRLEGRLGDSRIVPLSEWPIRMAHPREHHPLLTSEVH